ncbi:dsRBD fold-containing protein [Streptomyces sp.]|uniref:dsRBD fold-containing protein n=1 Tax=Streptomyces sp. TaxID=1931 RepID=UPI002F40E98D
MTQQKSAEPARTKTWTLRLDIFEEDEDVTSVRAALDTGDNTLVTHATAHRNPHDRPVPEIGDEYAAGRALLELGRQLVRAGTADAAANQPPSVSP